MRLIAERMQAMLQGAPGGYCLFSLQGLLREARRAPQILGIEKISHFEDVVAALKDGTDFVAAFRKLQQTGTAFVLQAETTRDPKPVRIQGTRLRIGREGPQFDMLWFSEGTAAVPATGEKKSAAFEQRLREAQAAFDALPFPVWARASDLSLILCNRAYAKALDIAPESVMREQHELISQTARGGSGKALAANAVSAGEAQSERRHVIIAGKRRLLEITEIPVKNEGTKRRCCSASRSTLRRRRKRTPSLSAI